MTPGNLYRRIFDEAQQRRRQHDTRLTAQIRRIEEKHGNQPAQDERHRQDDDTEAWRKRLP